MDFATLFGIIAGVVFIITGIVISGTLSDYYDPSSIMIVLGGTVASTLINYPFRSIMKIFPIVKNAFVDKSNDIEEGIQLILNMAMTARKDGILKLEDEAYHLQDSFVKKGILLIVDGTNPELVKNMLETELSFIEERHRQGQAIFESMAQYAPAFGMIGTLIGLINMLKNLDDQATLGPNMAVALITTFYGVILANLILLPLAGKLRQKSQQELLYKEIMLEGILSIQAGENPRIIEEKLSAFLKNTRKKEKNTTIEEAKKQYAQTQHQ
ncbi:MAG TPA: MotA/TolQ/ExbB proton channel family protein, partial [Clostridia bacterium]|nr:MotA/TolQ/ExbB proton channel family protein [Clostridia bacterium]